ncbi:MAG: aromatic aminobenezylarsenical efflux permease ArsG family transporter [Dehalococcoidia bacterium]|jgi:cytochrome c biogenesis protein CcdA
MGFSEFVLNFTQSGGWPVISAFLIGLLAAISPCPLTTNITALAFISRNITDRKYVAAAGALYTFGRIVSYFTIGAAIILAGVNVPGIADALQSSGEIFMGPLLIIVGILMLGIIKIPARHGGGRLAKIGERVARRRWLGPFLLGVVFALAFCPYTALLFFAVLIPLSIESTGGLTFPAVFAIGTGLPVLIFAVLLAFGVSKVSMWLKKVTAAEKWVRRIAAVVFIGVGIYYIVRWVQS